MIHLVKGASQSLLMADKVKSCNVICHGYQSIQMLSQLVSLLYSMCFSGANGSPDADDPCACNDMGKPCLMGRQNVALHP